MRGGGASDAIGPRATHTKSNPYPNMAVEQSKEMWAPPQRQQRPHCASFRQPSALRRSLCERRSTICPLLLWGAGEECTLRAMLKPCVRGAHTRGCPNDWPGAAQALGAGVARHLKPTLEAPSWASKGTNGAKYFPLRSHTMLARDRRGRHGNPVRGAHRKRCVMTVRALRQRTHLVTVTRNSRRTPRDRHSSLLSRQA